MIEHPQITQIPQIQQTCFSITVKYLNWFFPVFMFLYNLRNLRIDLLVLTEFNNCE